MSASETATQPKKTAAEAPSAVAVSAATAPPAAAAKSPRRKAKAGGGKKPPVAPVSASAPEVVAASAPAVTGEVTPIPAREPAPAIAAESATVAPAAKEGKHKKPAARKTKLVRDSFSFPETDYALFATLKQRALGAGLEIKKSELVRAGLSLLAGLSEEELVPALRGVDRIKTGRPKK